jgi:Tfp pilus assembly protein FimV
VEALTRLLAEMDGAEPVLREALGDPDPSVQALARELLAAHRPIRP